MMIDLEQQDLALELTELALVKAEGEDAIKFLNDQFTNDINVLDEKNWQFTGYCSAKGRLIAVMRLFKSGNIVNIIVPKSIAEVLIQRLQIYVFRAKVKFELSSDAIYGLHGANISKYIEIPPDKQQLAIIENGCILSLSANSQRYLMISPAIDVTDKLLTGESADSHWRLAEIREGIPCVYTSTIEKFIPQHVNLDQIDGVSFKKGCFPGQEIVARLHYLGKSKQTMQKLSLNSPEKLVAGDSIAHAQSNKPLTIVDAVEVSDQNFECLAVGQFS